MFEDDIGVDLIERRLDGEPTARPERRSNERPYRFVKPAYLTEVFVRRIDGRRITAIRRRGFGQYALAELDDRSVNVFVHRGDSEGEGGSNVFYLANLRRNHEPCSNLFEKLARKLAPRALIISDGSNARIRPLRRFHNKNIAGHEAYRSICGLEFSYGDRVWRCVGYMQRRNGPTLIWASDEAVRSA